MLAITKSHQNKTTFLAFMAGEITADDLKQSILNGLVA